MMRRTQKNAPGGDVVPRAEDEAMRRPRTRGRTRKGGRRATVALVPLAILASGAMVYQASNAAFTASTATPSNNWTAGTVALTDNDGNAALFSVSNVKPGVANGGTRCINVSYTGSLAATVKLYASGYTSAAGPAGGVLGNFLRASVEEGSGATDAACTGFTSDGTPKFLNAGGSAGQPLGTFSGANTAFAGNYANGATPWAAAAGNVTPQVRSVRIIWWLPDLGEPDPPASQAALDTLQGAAAAVTLNWEARNT